MEMAGLLTILFMAALTLAMPIAMMLLVWYFVRRQQNLQQQIWGAVAQQRRLNVSGQNMLGELNGQRVQVHTVRRGNGKNSSTYTVVRSTLSTPLDLGLEVRRQGWLSDMFLSGQDIIVGHAQFDAAFRISGDEPRRVVAALSQPLRALLFHQLRNGPTFYLNDDGLSIEKAGVVTDPRWLNWALDVASRGAAELAANRIRVPVASGLAQHQVSWGQFARSHNLHTSTTPLCVWGLIDRAEVYVYSVRTGVHQYQVDISLRFPSPLQLGLHISPQGLFDKIAIFLGSEDQKFDDPLFDDAFRVRCAIPERAEQLLSATIRQRLLRLQSQLGPLTVGDEGISVRLPYVPHEPAMIPRVVQALCELSEELQAALRGNAALAPYR